MVSWHFLRRDYLLVTLRSNTRRFIRFVGRPGGKQLGKYQAGKLGRRDATKHTLRKLIREREKKKTAE